jgi:hypothetical protein
MCATAEPKYVPPLLIGDYVEAVPQPSIEEKGMTTIRLHRLHLSSSPCPHTLAISWPHSQRVSCIESYSSDGALMVVMICDDRLIEIENDY